MNDSPRTSASASTADSPDDNVTYLTHWNGEPYSRSITGADWSRPIFDGWSLGMEDHLIELDDDSMERTPDVRVYFWKVGNDIRETDVDAYATHTLEQAKIYDDQVVREGREYIRKCRDQNIGFYLLDNTRDFASYNQLGKLSHRMSALGIAEDLFARRILCKQGEGYFDGFGPEDCEDIEDHCTKRAGIYLTNIRMPILWAELACETFRPGLPEWDVCIASQYSVHCMLEPLHDRRGWQYLIEYHFRHLESPICGSKRPAVTTREVTEAIIKRDWPELRPPPPNFKLPSDTMLNMTGGGSPRDFYTDHKQHKAPKKSLLSKITQRYGKSK